MPQRRWLAMVLGIALLLGCTHPEATVVSGTRIDNPGETYPAQVDGPVPCRPHAAPTTAEMLNLLTRVSMYAPLDHLTGPALALEQQWLAMERDSWPAESGTWVGDPWFALDIAEGADETYVFHLQHGEYVRTEDRFMIVCSDSRWQVRQSARGTDGQWLEPAHELAGQGAELTPALAAELIKTARTATGPWFAQVTTGNALAWGRVSAVYRARGWPKTYDDLRFAAAAEGLTINQIDPTHAEAGFPGQPPLVRFAKGDGLWKIANGTEGGAWTGPPRDVRLSEPGRVFDPPFGLLLGIADTRAIEQRFGPPDAVTQSDAVKTYIYDTRKLEFTFDAQGKVSLFAMKAGAPRSGVRVGSPIELWTLVYGPQAETDTSNHRYLAKPTVQNGYIVEIKVIRP